MTAFNRDTNGIPRCQVLVSDQPCNGLMFLTNDGRYLCCEKLHGKLIPVDSDQATIVRQAYRNRDNPSEAYLDRRWKESLPVAFKLGTVTRTVCNLGVVAKERVTAYQIGEALYKVMGAATRKTKPCDLEVVACAMSKSGRRLAKVFAPLTLTQDQIEKLQKQGAKK